MSDAFKLEVEQITFGTKHHFFGYIGQSKTIPWNQSGRYIAALQNDFQDHLPGPGEAADVILHRAGTERATRCCFLLFQMMEHDNFLLLLGGS